MTRDDDDDDDEGIGGRVNVLVALLVQSAFPLDFPYERPVPLIFNVGMKLVIVVPCLTTASW